MKDKFTKEECDFLRSFERGEWKPVPNAEKEIACHRAYAKATIKKDNRINIRIAHQDLESLQRAAVEEGNPYQTLISSILHKFASGRLIDRSKASSRK
jgi:predicted DNA binding CopG/RHH family protein